MKVWNRRHRLGRIVASTSAFVMLTLCSAPLPADNHQSGIPVDALVGWRRLEQWATGPMRFDGVYKATYIDGSHELCNVRFVRKGQFALLERTFVSASSGKEYAARVQCRGPRYSFVLGKNRMDRPFVLEGFAGIAESVPKGPFILLDNFIYRLVYRPFRVQGANLPDLIKQDSFSIEDLRHEVLDGHDVFAIDYSIVEPKVPSQSGTLRVDPTYDWAIVQSTRHSTGEAGLLLGKQTSGEDLNGYTRVDGRVCLSSFSDVSRAGDRLLESHEWTLKHASFESIDDEAFSLKAYGLAEVATEVLASEPFFSLGNWLFWVSLAGAILAFAALTVAAAKAKRTAT